MEKDKKIFKDMLVEVGNDVTKEIKSMYKNLSPGKNIVDIVRDYDSRHRKDNTILCPASIEINNILGFYSPIGKYNLRRDDLVSVTLSQQKEIKDGLFAYAKCSVSKSMYKVPSGIDKNDDIINACNIACIAGIKECGPDVRLSSIRFTISEILDSVGVSTLTDVCGYDLYDTLRVIPNTRQIPEFFSDRKYYKLIGEKMKDDDVLYIDVYGTDTSENVKSSRYEHILLLYRSSKIKYIYGEAKYMLSFINNTYKKNLFSLRELMENYPKYYFKRFPNKHKGRTTPKKFPEMPLKKLMKEGLILPYNTSEIKKEGGKDQKVFNNVAHIGHTIHIDELVKGGFTFIC